MFSSHYLVGQDVYPAHGQPQGGDRRGSYYNDGREGDEEDEEHRTITRLYRDPKIYPHHTTLLAHVPRGGGERMTSGGNRYLVGSGVVLDVTNPRGTRLALGDPWIEGLVRPAESSLYGVILNR